ncbi:PD-(D/E)XK nuclease family protein [Endozoicomonas euniceicola]|uniref:PD-(D/E)XK nuclease family protein n=1 Tax=Endozoicomonas euniceicola TaxID=1234143 RepID=A0ABY6GTW3_9GAMM|nr:PD-(D/E)XK nuclease family protein [Endozoicomonas euniceicola]UYM16225.1 PD-(D/E)XK nuclease family protein [Endozoicomonas euniceicola]
MKIPEEQNTTIKAIVKHYEDNQGATFRAHLGGSVIGRPCDRALWYSFRWATHVSHNGQLLRLFQTGHLAEERFVNDFRSIGIKVFETDPQTGTQFRVGACNGHFGGSFDGVGIGFVEAPKTWHLIEMKTHNDKSFNTLLKKGVRDAKPEHFIQMQSYMFLAKPQLLRAFYIAVNKNNDALYGERIKLDQDIGKATINRAQAIIASDRPLKKISTDPSWYLCKFCDHHAICHRQQAPEVNCRTCLHSTPVENGEWHCALYDLKIPSYQQKNGCDAHLYIPYLLGQFAEPVDSGENWIRYRLKVNGKEFVAGRTDDQFASSEIFNLNDKSLLTDDNLSAIKQHFNGKVVPHEA